MLRLLLLLGLALPVQAAPLAPTKPTTDLEHLIAVEIESSRPQLVAGEGLAVIARIKNVSKIPVYIREDSFALTVPLEMEGSRGNISGYASFFPTELHKADDLPENPDFYKKVRLNPGDTYSAFWTSTFANSTSSLVYILQQITTQFQFLFFSPGRYSITLNAKYWTDPSPTGTNYRTLSKSMTANVVAPLFVILFGAALGGLIAHFVLPGPLPSRGVPRSRAARAGQRGLAMLGSALLSVIVTIMLARVSESQFLVSVTVNDFWGAIVTGFVANYVGYKALQRLLPGLGDADEAARRASGAAAEARPAGD